MPELVEQMYCSQQIVIPPKYPYVLKRYAKAAIKTQPHDLLAWSFHYFKALAEKRTPPVKLRLEYPVYSTEGGLTRGYLKVLANQLEGIDMIPLWLLRRTWQGSCLDLSELKRISCLAGVHMRQDKIPRLHFIAVAGGLLTKTLTHTMILICETLTKEPDGGSAAIPVEDFLNMYRFLANIDASRNCKYINGYMEGEAPENESVEEEQEVAPSEASFETTSQDEYWEASRKELHKLAVIDDNVASTAHISKRMVLPIVEIHKLERAPSAERAAMIERENYMLDRRSKGLNPEMSADLGELSGSVLSSEAADKDAKKKKSVEEVVPETQTVELHVYDEEDNEVPFDFYGEPDLRAEEDDAKEEEEEAAKEENPEEQKEEQIPELTEKEKLAEYLAQSYSDRDDRRIDLEQTFNDISAIVHKYKSTYYDLSMVAGRQMSTTSAEFIVAYIEQDIIDCINEQIAILPDPDLKKKKAKPHEVAMIKDLLYRWLDDNMDIIVPEVEEEEEEEAALPDITVVYEVPGIGPKVDKEIMLTFVDYALEVSKTQAEMFMPRNIRHFLCPPLEKYLDPVYESTEEVPTCGTIVD